MTKQAAQIYSPEPNVLEEKAARFLAERCSGHGGRDERERVKRIGSVTRWVVGLAALAGILSGGLIGGSEVYVRQELLGGEDVDWTESWWPYWTLFFVFAGIVSAIEIIFLYVLALKGIEKVTRYSGLPLSQESGGALFKHSLARAALEFPNSQVSVYGIDPYTHVANWQLTALNIAYKLKVGVSSFILRVFLRRVAARMAVRGMVPLFAGPLYAVWNAWIVWRIMTEARMRTLGPFAVDNLIEAHFEDAGDLDATEKEVLLHGAGEMLTQGRDAHPNQVYLLTRLRDSLGHEEEIALDWDNLRAHLPRMEAEAQTRVLDLLTLSAAVGARVHRGQMALLRSACEECGAHLEEKKVKALHKALKRGHDVTQKDLAATRTGPEAG